MARAKFKDPQRQRLIEEAFQTIKDPLRREVIMLVRRGLAAYVGVSRGTVTVAAATIVYDAGPFRITRRA